MQPADVLVTETVEVLERTAKHMRKLARLLRRSRVRLIRGDYDALYAFGEQAGKALAVGSDVGTRLEPLLRMLTPDEYQ